MQTLKDWLKTPGRTRLRRCFTVWIGRVLLPACMPGIKLRALGTILEGNTMLAERVEEWTDKWRAEGRAEGVQAGVQLGQTLLLQKQLALRFGPLPDWVLAYLRDASSEDLERWSLRIFDQPSLPDIFK